MRRVVMFIWPHGLCIPQRDILTPPWFYPDDAQHASRWKRRQLSGPFFCRWDSEGFHRGVEVRVPPWRCSLVERTIGECPAKAKIVDWEKLESAIRDDDVDDWVRFWVLFLVSTQRFNARSLSSGIVHSVTFSVLPLTYASHSYPSHIPAGTPRYLLSKQCSLT